MAARRPPLALVYPRMDTNGGGKNFRHFRPFPAIFGCFHFSQRDALGQAQGEPGRGKMIFLGYFGGFRWILAHFEVSLGFSIGSRKDTRIHEYLDSGLRRNDGGRMVAEKNSAIFGHFPPFYSRGLLWIPAYAGMTGCPMARAENFLPDFFGLFRAFGSWDGFHDQAGSSTGSGRPFDKLRVSGFKVHVFTIGMGHPGCQWATVSDLGLGHGLRSWNWRAFDLARGGVGYKRKLTGNNRLRTGSTIRARISRVVAPIKGSEPSSAKATGTTTVRSW